MPNLGFVDPTMASVTPNSVTFAGQLKFAQTYFVMQTMQAHKSWYEFTSHKVHFSRKKHTKRTKCVVSYSGMDKEPSTIEYTFNYLPLKPTEVTSTLLERNQ